MLEAIKVLFILTGASTYLVTKDATASFNSSTSRLTSTENRPFGSSSLRLTETSLSSSSSNLSSLLNYYPTLLSSKSSTAEATLSNVISSHQSTTLSRSLFSKQHAANKSNAINLTATLAPDPVVRSDFKNLTLLHIGSVDNSVLTKNQNVSSSSFPSSSSSSLTSLSFDKLKSNSIFYQQKSLNQNRLSNSSSRTINYRMPSSVKNSSDYFSPQSAVVVERFDVFSDQYSSSSTPLPVFDSTGFDDEEYLLNRQKVTPTINNAQSMPFITISTVMPPPATISTLLTTDSPNYALLLNSSSLSNSNIVLDTKSTIQTSLSPAPLLLTNSLSPTIIAPTTTNNAVTISSIIKKINDLSIIGNDDEEVEEEAADENDELADNRQIDNDEYLDDDTANFDAIGQHQPQQIQTKFAYLNHNGDVNSITDNTNMKKKTKKTISTEQGIKYNQSKFIKHKLRSKSKKSSPSLLPTTLPLTASQQPVYEVMINEEEKNLPKKLFQVKALMINENSGKNSQQTSNNNNKEHGLMFILNGNGVDYEHPDRSKFAINAFTGELFLIASVDRDPPNGRDLYRLNITAEDENGAKVNGSVLILVRVRDINDNAPYFEQEIYRANVSENSGSGIDVIRLAAIDRDVDSIVRYSIEMNRVNSDGELIFDIDELSGVVSTAVCCLDRESIDQFTIKVCVTDEAISGDTNFHWSSKSKSKSFRNKNQQLTTTISPSAAANNQSACTSIIIDVTDENDELPRFLRDKFFVNLPDGVNELYPGRTLLNTSVADGDLPQSNRFVCRLNGFARFPSISNNQNSQNNRSIITNNNNSSSDTKFHSTPPQSSTVTFVEVNLSSSFLKFFHCEITTIGHVRLLVSDQFTQDYFFHSFIGEFEQFQTNQRLSMVGSLNQPKLPELIEMQLKLTVSDVGMFEIDQQNQHQNQRTLPPIASSMNGPASSRLSNDELSLLLVHHLTSAELNLKMSTTKPTNPNNQSSSLGGKNPSLASIVTKQILKPNSYNSEQSGGSQLVRFGRTIFGNYFDSGNELASTAAASGALITMAAIIVILLVIVVGLINRGKRRQNTKRQKQFRKRSTNGGTTTTSELVDEIATAVCCFDRTNSGDGSGSGDSSELTAYLNCATGSNSCLNQNSSQILHYNETTNSNQALIPSIFANVGTGSNGSDCGETGTGNDGRSSITTNTTVATNGELLTNSHHNHPYHHQQQYNNHHQMDLMINQYHHNSHGAQFNSQHYSGQLQQHSPEPSTLTSTQTDISLNIIGSGSGSGGGATSSSSCDNYSYSDSHHQLKPPTVTATVSAATTAANLFLFDPDQNQNQRSESSVSPKPTESLVYSAEQALCTYGFEINGPYDIALYDLAHLQLPPTMLNTESTSTTELASTGYSATTTTPQTSQSQLSHNHLYHNHHQQHHHPSNNNNNNNNQNYPTSPSINLGPSGLAGQQHSYQHQHHHHQQQHLLTPTSSSQLPDIISGKISARNISSPVDCNSSNSCTTTTTTTATTTTKNI